MASIEKRNGSYRITVSAGYDLSGKQIKKYMTYTPAPNMTERQIQKEVQRQAVLFEEKVQSGQLLDSSIRFIEFADYWLKEYAYKQLRPSTIVRYEKMLIRINAALGNIKLNRLQPKHLIELYNKLSEDGERAGILYQANKNLSAIFNAQGLTFKRLSEICGLSARTVALAIRGERTSEKTAKK